MFKSTAMHGRCGLAIMARFPDPGRVKTRLAAVFGEQWSCELYRAFLADIAWRFAAGPRPLIWMYDPPDRPFAQLLDPGACCLPQQGQGLAERMHDCFRRLLSAPTLLASVVMIGADVPHLPAVRIDEAERALAEVDLVLGPSTDGGYYLIAMRQPHDVFSDVEMGSAETLRQTLARAARLGLAVRQLEPWFDIDDAADAARLRQMLDADDDLVLPATAAVLACMPAVVVTQRRS